MTDEVSLEQAALVVYVASDQFFDFWGEQLLRAYAVPVSDIEVFLESSKPKIILWPVTNHGIAPDAPVDAMQSQVREQTALFARLSDISAQGVPITRVSPDKVSVALPNGIELATPNCWVEAQGPADQALALYNAGPPVIGSIAFWPPELFTFDPRDAELRVHHNEMQMIGRARHLVFGPYLSLPAGRWRVAARFRCDNIGASHGLRFEWGGLETFVSFDVTPGKGGRYEAVLETEWSQSQQVECRVILTASALEGWFAFDGAEVQKLA